MSWDKVVLLVGSLFTSGMLHAQIVSQQDTTLVGVGAGATMIFRSNAGLQRLDQEIQNYAQGLAREIEHAHGRAAGLMSQASQLEQGLVNHEYDTIYTGRYGDAEDYNTYAGEPSQMRDNAFRLQEDGAEKLIAKLSKDPRFHGKPVALVLKRVDGTDGNSIRMASDIKLTGTISDLRSKVLNFVSQQSEEIASESIVGVEVHFETQEAPNPEAARALRVQSESLTSDANASQAGLDEKVESLRREKAKVVKRLKNLRAGGVALIVGSVTLGAIRYGLAKELVTLARSCESTERLDTLAQGLALGANVSEDLVELELRTLCANSN